MDSQQQQFCLKWNSFGSNLATSFSNLFKSESLADVTLFCEGELNKKAKTEIAPGYNEGRGLGETVNYSSYKRVTFKAHKLILAACSKHLADLFETAPLHQNLLVILDGTSANNMSALLEFMYKGEVHVSQDALSSFLKAAECLQVKGLSIEHEKLAVAQSQTNMDTLDSPTTRKQLRVLNEDSDGTNLQQQSSPSPSYSPAMSPYMHPHHYRQYDQRIATSNNTSFEPSTKRSLRSPNELLQETVRASVLRDGSKAGRPGSPGPMSLAYRPSSSSSCSLQQLETDGTSENRFNSETTATALICPESKTNDQCRDPGCPEDLRMKIDPLIQEEPLSSTGNANGNNGAAAANGSIGSLSNYKLDREKSDLIPSSLWNSVTGKLAKTGSVYNT
ncbi:hypothetical protein FQA39_LY14951 [Lamprigera yunnana]|nr:hypothetical protein FQA39_LY14951 [Lamprigera yunnana]